MVRDFGLGVEASTYWRGRRRSHFGRKFRCGGGLGVGVAKVGCSTMFLTSEFSETCVLDKQLNLLYRGSEGTPFTRCVFENLIPLKLGLWVRCPKQVPM
jgi:hypothetical protein